MLKLIRLKRFKKFQDVEAHLRPFTVLMGENSSGKTTILQAINSAMILLAGSGLVTGTNETLKVKNAGAPMFALPGVILEDYKGLFYGNIPRGGKERGTAGIAIELVDDNGNNYRITINYLFGGLNAKCISKLKELSNNPTLHLKLPLLISGFVGLLPSEERSYSVALGQKLRSGQMSAIIRNILLDTKLKKPESFDRLQKRLAKDFNFYLDKISFDEQKDVHVTARYKEGSSSTRSFSLDINSSGSGFLQILQILAPIYCFCPDDSSIVLLDEPDAHLHPNLQASLASALHEIQKELDIQIIISTHSTSIIRAADPSEVVPVSSKLKSIQPLTHSEDVERQILTYIDSYELGKSVISGKLVFIEDKDTSIIEAFDKLLKTNCFSGTNTVPMLNWAFAYFGTPS
ncbi:hypothetical protein NIES4106_23290 [Fischerella sp. NIES-4106]|nr:hypothetical protein NIES4106_23290 [Fischerella sp. NIES-4106]